MPHVDATAAMTFDERYRAIDGRPFDRHLLPSQLSRAHAQACQRHVLSHVGRGPRGGVPGLQAVPAGSRARLARMGPAR